MQKQTFIIIIALFCCAPVFAQRGKLIQKFIEKKLDNDAAPNTGPVPDYSNPFFWAASPYKHDPSDSIPSFLKNEKRDSSVDVFFIHPTSYQDMNKKVDLLNDATDKKQIFNELKTVPWNADLTDTALNNETDYRPILYQASVFNGSCRVFAPRYRQANIKAFFARTSDASKKAFDLAYADIKQAFEYYLKYNNNGRPIIIASHSQGSLHAIRLLQEYFDGKPLQQKLVCAYIIGYQIEPDAFKKIPVGISPAQTGCYVGWRSYQKDVLPKAVAEENGKSVCVNPLTWTTSSTEAPKELNKGSLLGFNMLVQQSVAATIEPSSNILWVTMPEKGSEKMKQMKNLHVFDYNLFWMNIRTNVKERINAYRQLNQ